METILIVDDDQDLQVLIADILQDEGYNTIAVSTGKQAIKAVRKKTSQIVLLDMKLPDTNGMQLLEEIKRTDPTVITLMLTAYGDVKDAVQAMKLGAYDYLTKPFDNEELVLVIKKALQTQYLSSEVESLRKKLAEKTAITERFIGESPQIQHILKQVNIIAPTSMTVIIHGESGTGKELIANMIHQVSPRKENPCIPIDCGAIPETLIESELFGYEKGAFTGADARKKGKFEQAEGGTLFLDEVINLPENAQVKLLRVIQERTLQHVGGRKNIPINVRIIAATNKDLSNEIKQGTFREDLFHRLNEFSISLPPLRERKEDIPILSKYFLDEANREFGKNIKGFSAETMKLFFRYPWTGNVRELRNEIRKAVLLSETDQIKLGHLSMNFVEPQDEISGIRILDNETTFEDIIKTVEKQLIQRALEETGGNKAQAAKILHINRKRLYRKMESLGM
jgi:DNA-binding NtrC family response regulator